MTNRQIERTLKISFLMELQALKKIDHQNVCKLIGYQLIKHKLSIILDKYDCSLHRAIEARYARTIKVPFAVTDIVRFISQITNGLAHLHHHGIAHRDLKSDNIVVRLDHFNENEHARTPQSDSNIVSLAITDFGVSKMVSEYYPSASTVVGTPAYMVFNHSLLLFLFFCC